MSFRTSIWSAIVYPIDPRGSSGQFGYFRNYPVLARASAPILFLLILGLVWPGKVAGQNVSQARILGTVADVSGAIVPDAKVVITSQTTRYSRTVQTGEDGTYLFPQMPGDTYDIEVSKPGFKTGRAVGVLVQVNENVRRDFQLEVGEMHATVEVLGQSTLVNTYTAALTQTINTRAVVELPLNNRDITALSMLVAGATDPVATSFYASSAGFMDGVSPSVNGGKIQDNGYHLDGLNNVYAERFSANIFPNPDAIEEFTMNTAQYSAEFGGRPGGQLSARTKSGTNALHGALFEFVRNPYFNARNFFDTSGKNDGIKRNQYGWAVGGPVYIPHVFDGRNKLFFFNSYQRIPFSQRGIPAFHRAWTAAEKAGDWSDRLTGTTIFDPGTANSSCGSLGTPFPGNVIPATLFDTVAVNFLKHTPDAATPTSLIPYFIPQRTLQYEFLQKVDWNVGKHAIMGRYMRTINTGSSFNDPNDLLFTSGTNALGAHAGNNNVGVTETWSVSPNKVITAGFQYSDWPWYQVPMPHLFTLEDFGSQLKTDPDCKEYTFAVIGFVDSIGDRQDKCNVRLDALWQYTAALKWVRGRHEIAIGGDFERWTNPRKLGFNRLRDGTFTFNGAFTGLSEADFLIGRAVSWSIQNPSFSIPAVAAIGMHRNIYSAYFEVTFRVRKGLTLNLGLRWEPSSAPSYNGTIPVNSWLYPGQQSRVFANAPPGILYNGDPGTPGRSGWFRRYNQIAPRLGFAWDPTGTGKWAIRGGVGSYFGQEGGSDQQLPGGNSPPLSGATITIINPPNMVNPWAAPPYNGTVGVPLPLPTTNSPVSTPFGGLEIFDPHMKSPNNYTWSLTVERSFGASLLLRAGYVGLRGTHQMGGYNTNLATYIPGGSDGTNIQQRRPDPNFTSFLLSTADGDSYYHAFQVTAEKRYSHGLSFLANYTFSKSIDTDSTNIGWTGAWFFGNQDPRGSSFNKGLSDFDRTHVISVSPVWDLPKLHNANPAVRAVLGNWRMSSIVSLRSGHPVTAIDLFGAGGCLCGPNLGTSRADATGTPLQTAIGSRSNQANVGYFNQSAFRSAAVGSFGTVGRNTIRGPGFANVDFALIKDFPIPVRENMRLQFRSEYFNLFNRVNLGNPSLNVNDPNFGKIFGTSSDPRILQFGVKFIF
ncbi:MAG: hypothetical protein DMG05_03645 [Acidobacteria bacterium]|nr:MAG: hypothetical protein DMG05_03645 [Acidobacteriota bacterium]